VKVPCARPQSCSEDRQVADTRGFLMSGYKTVGMTVEHSRHVFVPAHLMTSLVYMEKEYTMGGL
jgi:hypothetical protein